MSLNSKVANRGDVEDEVPAYPEFDLAILQAIFHDRIEAQADAGCVHQNQHAGGTDCGRSAIDFIADYSERWMKEYGNG